MTTLESAYSNCRRMHRRHGVTSFWASRLMSPVKRPHIDAIYAFLRRADDIVDVGSFHVEQRAARLDALEREFLVGLDDGRADDPVVFAMVHTSRVFAFPATLFERFFGAMRADLTATGFDTFADLAAYMDGSSVTAGEMMLPILEADFAGARSYGRDLAFAVHLTNMIRDVAEDLDRGRVYIPREDLDRFGADPRKRLVTREWRELMRFEIERARGYYSSAEIGISHLSSRSAACLRAGADLYSRILDRLEANGFDVFNGRVVVPLATKLAVAGRHAVLIGRSG